ncbi:stalk domain-containing protein [Brevibacillus fulvus]|uniref:Copper amine oxidase-like N-terminal domain-containing protein n=1 Tax=Brevibacillus fulvus TaxID=1125967 RepID=A0A939BR28_9BACL|nr:stalk domain-containing protein [Brevibacillus fulvus]MBM7589142.1 hypothetical protein [Brevibacillus fulvus]
MKKYGLILFCLCWMWTTGAALANPNPSAQPAISIDGVIQPVSAAIIKGTTFVPLRPALETFGANVNYSPSTKEIRALMEHHEFVYKLGEATAVINGKTVEVSPAPFVRDGMTYIPLKLVSLAFDGNLLWDGAARKVIIRSPKNNLSNTDNQLKDALADPAQNPQLSRLLGPPAPISNNAGTIPGGSLYMDLQLAQKRLIITNLSNQTIDLSNCKLTVFGKKQAIYSFSDGFLVPAGQNLLISLSSGSGDIVWNIEPLLNNDRANRFLLTTARNEVILDREG